MEKIKADLHYHGLIGFHEPWFKIQGYNPKTLGEKIINSAIKNKVNIIGLTSEQYEIPKGSEHDRFNFLFNNLKQNPNYKVDKLDNKDIAFVAERKKDGGILTILNSQMVIVNQRDNERRYLAIGSNQLPNQKNYFDTLKRGREMGLIQIMNCRYLSKEGLEYFDAIEGHDSQNRWSVIFKSVPAIGQITKDKNMDAKKFSESVSKPWISVSNAHTPESVGKASIEFPRPYNYGEKILESIKENIEKNFFKNNVGYESALACLKWQSQFVYGVKFNKGS